MAEAALAKKPESQPGAKGKAKPAQTEIGGQAGMPAFLGGAVRSGGAPQFLQRQPFLPSETIDEEAFEEGQLQRMPEDPFPDVLEDEEEDHAGAEVQAKLEVNAPGDAFEQQADQVAEAVTRPGPSPAPSAPANGAAATIQRCETCGGEKGGDGACPSCAAKLQRKTEGADRAKPSTNAADAVASPGAGAPLDPTVREHVEPTLGRDLSHVRVHSDSRAHQAASSIEARAFTHGDHIWLGPGQSGSDLALMAHEATHTVQQRESGGGGPALIQRAPSDHRHTEDGAGPRGRMNAAMEKDLGDVDPPEPGEPRPDFDPAEKSAKAGGLEGQARPDVDRPATEAPGIEQAASAVEAEAEQPGEPIAEGDAAASGTPPEAAAESAGAELNAAQTAMAAATTMPVPDEPSALSPPEIVAPVNADGEPMVLDMEAEARVQLLAGQLQAARQGAHAMRLKARQERANATLIRGNIALVDGHVAEAETGLTVAGSQLDYRREVIAESENALATSEEKAATVAAEAPGYETEAAEAEDESGPIASESAATSAENAANTPDDPEAAADAAEQGGQMDEVAGDAASMDQASAATKARAVELQADAAEATTKNAETRGRIDEAGAVAEATGERIGEMAGEAGAARGEIDALKDRPGDLDTEAARLEAGAVEVIARTEARSAALTALQTDFQRDAARVPGSETLAEQNAGSIQREEVPGGAEGPAGAGTETAAGEREYAPSGYSGRESVDLRSALFGQPQLTEEQQEKQAVAQRLAEERRRSRITALEEQYGADLSELGMLDRAGIALGFMRDDLFSSVTDIKWPDFSAAGFGKALISVFNPLGPLEGVLGGLSKVASGTLNLFDPDQWARDPLGNLLKSAADIATGITVILGSIVALAGVIMAIMAALIVVTLGWASPVALPVITFCGNVTITVGGWTIAVGLLALQYQSLLFIKNLIDAMTAETAEELVIESEQMTEDTKQAGEIAMQVGTAAVGRIGGAGMMDEIAGIGAAGAQGGPAALRQAALGYARRETVDGLKDAMVEGALGEDLGQLYGIAQMGRALHGARSPGGEGDGGGTGRAGAEGDAAPARAAEAAEADAPRTPDEPDSDTASPPETPAAETVPAPRPLAPDTPAATPHGGAAAEPPRPSQELDSSPAPEPEARSIDEAAASPDAGGETAPGAAGGTRPTPPPDGPAPDADSQARPADVPRIDDSAAPAAARGRSEAEPGRRIDDAADTEAARDRSEEAADEARPREEGPTPDPETAARERGADADEVARASAADRDGAELTDTQLQAELGQAAERPRRPVSDPEMRRRGYVEEVSLDNGHTWRRREDGTWCRFSTSRQSACGFSLTAGQIERGVDADDPDAIIDDIAIHGPDDRRPDQDDVRAAQEHLNRGEETEADERIIMAEAVADARQSLQLSRGDLSACAIAGGCGTARSHGTMSATAMAAGALGQVRVDQLHPRQLFDASVPDDPSPGTPFIHMPASDGRVSPDRGEMASHVYAVVTFPSGRQYILDPTIGQFVPARTSLPEGAGRSPLRDHPEVAVELLGEGFVPLTPASAEAHAGQMRAHESEMGEAHARMSEPGIRADVSDRAGLDSEGQPSIETTFNRDRRHVDAGMAREDVEAGGQSLVERGLATPEQVERHAERLAHHEHLTGDPAQPVELDADETLLDAERTASRRRND